MTEDDSTYDESWQNEENILNHYEAILDQLHGYHEQHPVTHDVYESNRSMSSLLKKRRQNSFIFEQPNKMFKASQSRPRENEKPFENHQQMYYEEPTNYAMMKCRPYIDIFTGASNNRTVFVDHLEYPKYNTDGRLESKFNTQILDITEIENELGVANKKQKLAYEQKKRQKTDPYKSMLMPTNTSQRSQYPTHKISLVKNEPERKKVEEIKYIRKIPNEPKSLSEETKSRIIEWLEDSSQSFTKIRNDDNNVVKREIKKVAQRPISLNTAMVKRERYEVRTKSNDAQSGLVDREMLDLKKTEEKRRQQRQFEKEFGLDGPYIQDDYYKWYHAQCHKFNGRSVHEIPTKVIHTTGDTLRKSPIGVLNGLKKDVSSSSFRKKTSHSPFNKQRKPSTPTQTNTSRSSRNFDGKQRISSLSRKKNNSKSLFIVNNDEELKEALTRMEETIRVIREKFNDLEVSDNSKNNLQKSDLKRKLSNIHYLIFQSKTFLSKKV